MTVALDTYTDHGAAVVDPSWSHTGGSARAAIVCALYVPNADTVSWTYGGTDMGAAIVTNLSSGGELDFLELGIWFLDDVATGTQTVDHTGTTVQVKTAGCYTLTSAGGAIESVDTDATIDSTAIVDPSATLALAARDCFCCIVFGSGQDTVGGVTPFTSWTSDRELDNGTTIVGTYSYDTIASADVSAGWTQTSEDALGLSAAFAEIATASTPNLLTLLGVG